MKQSTQLIYTSREINRNFRIKVYGLGREGGRINKLVGVSGIIALIGEDFLAKFLHRAYACMDDRCVCKLRRGLVVTFYAK